MTHKAVFEHFKSYFPQFIDQSETWFPNGKNSVRVRLKNKRDIIFTFRNTNDWCLESIDSHIKHMKYRKGE